MNRTMRHPLDHHRHRQNRLAIDDVGLEEGVLFDRDLQVEGLGDIDIIVRLS